MMTFRTPLIHPDTISRVKESAEITDVVSDHVVLKKTGKDLTGFCPFHENKRTPSFTVVPSKNFYHCFSCGESGDPIKFLMQIGNNSFADTILGLANRYSIPVEYQESTPQEHQQATRRELLLKAADDASKFYQGYLYSEGGASALTYLRQERKLSDITIQQFGLGASPQGWTHLLDHLLALGHTADSIEGAGLAIRRKDGQGFYDRFRGRVMVPVSDSLGRSIGFGARALNGEMPKYINSPETDLFGKGQTLYGLNLAKAAIAKEDRAIVVEGYFDAIALHSQGITNVVASQGTALGKQQIRQLLRHTESNRLVLNFDADTAGGRAAERAIGEVESLAQQGLVDLRILSLAGHKDADEYIAAQGPGTYRTAILKAPLWVEWQIDRLLSGLDLADGAAIRVASLEISGRLSAINDAATKTLYCHRYAEQLARGDARLAIQLETDLRRGLRGLPIEAASLPRSSERPTPRDSAELQLLKIYLHCPSQRINLDRMLTEAVFEFQNQIHQAIWEIFGSASRLHSGGDWGLIIGSYLVDAEPEVYQIAKGVINLTEVGRINICNNPAIVAQGALATIARLEAKKRRSEYFAELANQPIASVEDCVGLAIEQGGDDAIVLAQKALNAGAYRCQELISQQDDLIRESELKRSAKFVSLRSQRNSSKPI